MPIKVKKTAVLNRIKSLESDIVKAREYLDTGAHAHWHGFRPLFSEKIRDGKILPPHKDWVKNVFIPSHERALKTAEKLIDRISN